jgi:hypothetical protein
MRIVSDKLSPFSIDEDLGSAMPIELPPIEEIAASKLILVLVLGS